MVHYVAVNVDYAETGEMRSWDVEPCTCDRPWRHPELAP